MYSALQKQHKYCTQHQSREMQENNETSDSQQPSSARGQKLADHSIDLPLFKLNVTTEMQASKKRN